MKRVIKVAGQPRKFRKPRKTLKQINARVRSDKAEPAFNEVEVALTNAIIQTELAQMQAGVAVFRELFGDDGIHELQEKGILDENEEVVAPPAFRRGR